MSNVLINDANRRAARVLCSVCAIGGIERIGVPGGRCRRWRGAILRDGATRIGHREQQSVFDQRRGQFGERHREHADAESGDYVQPGFCGNQLFFLAARSNTANSNWQPVGSVSVP